MPLQEYAVSLVKRVKQVTVLSYQDSGEFKATEPDGILMITRNIWLPSTHFKNKHKGYSLTLGKIYTYLQCLPPESQEAPSIPQITLCHMVLHFNYAVQLTTADLAAPRSRRYMLSATCSQ